MMSLEPGSDLATAPSAGQAFGPYLQAVRRHWKLVALVTILAVLVTGISLERATADLHDQRVDPGHPAARGLRPRASRRSSTRGTQPERCKLRPRSCRARMQRSSPRRRWASHGPHRASRPRSRSPPRAPVMCSISVARPRAPVRRRASPTPTRRNSVDYRGQRRAGSDRCRDHGHRGPANQLQTAHAPAAETSALATAVEQLRAVQGTGAEPTLSCPSRPRSRRMRTERRSSLVLLLALVRRFRPRQHRRAGAGDVQPPGPRSRGDRGAVPGSGDGRAAAPVGTAPRPRRSALDAAGRCLRAAANAASPALGHWGRSGDHGHQRRSWRRQDDRRRRTGRGLRRGRRIGRSDRSGSPQARSRAVAPAQDSPRRPRRSRPACP